MFDSQFKISNLTLSNNTKALIVAEIGINHEGDFNKCLKLSTNTIEINQENFLYCLLAFFIRRCKIML